MAKPARKAKAPTPRARTVGPSKKPIPEPVAPAAARKEYERLLAVIATAEVTEARGFDERWEAIERVRQKHFYLLEDDTPTFVAWLKKFVGESERTALRNLRVSAIASPAEIARYTVSKINLALSIRDATARRDAEKKGVPWTQPDRPAPIDLAALRFTVVRADKKRNVDLESVTQDELESIVSDITGSKARREKSRRESLSPTARKLVAAVHKARLQNIEITEHDNQLNIVGARADQLAALAKVLAQLAADEG